MGIGGNFIEILGSLRRRGYLRTPSAVVEIGAQQLANSFLEAQPAVDALGDLFGIDRRFPLPAPQISQVVHGTLEHLNSAAPMARGFYEWLGFRYACIDIDGSPGSIALDLNYDSTPLNETGSYQLVTNFGTTEHVANQLNAFKIIHELCAPGGLMIHVVPTQGMFNHGLVNYNPKFFWMLARSNNYRFLHMEFAASDTYYMLPQNIVDAIVQFQPNIVERRETIRASDSMLTIILEKRFDIPYVAPLDVATGTRTHLAALAERYWTVFKPEMWEEIRDRILKS